MTRNEINLKFKIGYNWQMSAKQSDEYSVILGKRILWEIVFPIETLVGKIEDNSGALMILIDLHLMPISVE